MAGAGWKRWMKRIGYFALGLWLVATGCAKYFENDLVFPAEKESEAWSEPADPATRDVRFASADGTSLHGRFLPCAGSDSAILFNHGNGGNVSHRDDRIRKLREAFGRAVFVYDYPGYGRSQGSPSEASICASGEAAYAWLREKYPAQKIVFFGESLGGAVAIDLATRHPCEGLVVFSTFESLPKAAKNRFPFLPCETLMVNRFESVEKLPRIRTPVYIAHGDADEVIPLDQARNLFDAANEPKQFRVRAGASHGSPFDLDVCSEARRFLDRHKIDGITAR